MMMYLPLDVPEGFQKIIYRQGKKKGWANKWHRRIGFVSGDSVLHFFPHRRPTTNKAKKKVRFIK